MTMQDRFFIEQASSTRAAARPDALTFLPIVQGITPAPAIVAGAAVCIGFGGEAWAQGGPALVMPLLLGVSTTALLMGGWHLTSKKAAHARKTHHKALAMAFASGLFLAGTILSAWPLSSILGGPAAVQEHEQQHIDRLNAALSRATSNATAEAAISTNLDAAAGNLGRTANGEAAYGLVTKKSGAKVVTASIRAAGENFASVSKQLHGMGMERDRLLSQARDLIGEAQKARTEHDAAHFQEAVTSASAAIKAADDVRYSSALLGLGNGLATGEAKAVIGETVQAVQLDALSIGKQRRPIELPAYVPVDPREAMRTNPQPLAWLTSVCVEAIPLLLVGILASMSSWKKENDDNDGKANQAPEVAAWPVPIYSPPRTPLQQQAAE